jgi:hypothetical protein
MTRHRLHGGPCGRRRREQRRRDRLRFRRRGSRCDGGGRRLRRSRRRPSLDCRTDRRRGGRCRRRRHDRRGNLCGCGRWWRQRGQPGCDAGRSVVIIRGRCRCSASGCRERGRRDRRPFGRRRCNGRGRRRR